MAHTQACLPGCCGHSPSQCAAQGCGDICPAHTQAHTQED